ncbi:MAG: TonB-dependent siderophore receptor [Nevskiales bacterium]|nr:TonB-dependent siderophore receptor [Nevskiales bacterium]
MEMKQALCAVALLLICVTTLLLAVTLPAHAEEPVVPSTPPETTGTVTPLQEVKVIGESETEGYAVKNTRTATRTDTPLLDVPQSITVVTQEQIRDQAMQNLGDVVRYVPGVGMAQGEGNRETPIFRGNSSTSDFFVDGLRDDVQYFRDLYNIDRVEVLKGPNAMIFGRGGVGGVINRVTRWADWTPLREVTLQLGSFENARTTFDLHQGFSDTFAAGVTGLYEDTNSYRDHVTLERSGINPTFAVKAGPDTQLRLGLEYFRDERVADRGIPSFQGRPFETDEATFFGDPGRSPTDTYVQAYTAFVDHDFGGGLSLRNATRYGDYDKYYQNVFASGAVSGGTVPIQAYNSDTQRENLFNQTDLVYTFATGSVAHTLLGGLELGSQDTTNLRLTGTFVSTATTTFNTPISSPTINEPVTFAPSASDANNNGRATIAAVYVQDQIEFTPQIMTVFGLRYDHFKVNFHDDRASATVRQIITKDDLLSPRLGLIYKPVERASIYTAYSLSYLPRAGEQLGSLSVSPTSTGNAALEPEEFINYEIGAKWDLRPDLAVSAALYQLDRNNVAIPDPMIPTQLILVDGQETRGLELGLSGRVTSDWSIAGGYAWQTGVLTAGSLSGATLAQLPKHTFSLWNRYDFTPMWGAGLGVYASDDWYASTSNTVTLPGYARLDAAVFFTLNRNLRAQLNVENLLDEDYFLNAHNDNNLTPGSPAAVRVGLIANF